MLLMAAVAPLLPPAPESYWISKPIYERPFTHAAADHSSDFLIYSIEILVVFQITEMRKIFSTQIELFKKC